MNDPVFLGEKGITSTSANYLANLAQELIVKDKELLDSACFYNSYVSIVGSESAPQLATKGNDDDYLKSIPTILDRMAKMNAFCAWTREAIKAKSEILSYVESAEPEGIQTPKMPALKQISIESVLESLNIKERCEYLTLEAIAATLGKAIHSAGALNIARKEAHKALSNPVKTQGNGRDMLISTYETSANLNLVDSTYEQLQNTYRQYEARLNSIKFKLQEEVHKLNMEFRAEYDAAADEYQIASRKRFAEIKAWRDKERERISKLKIIIPNELQETYEYLNSVGSQGANS